MYKKLLLTFCTSIAVSIRHSRRFWTYSSMTDTILKEKQNHFESGQLFGFRKKP